jgi:hypothetical protein
MLQRFLIAYAILTIGLTGISIGMKGNGSASPRNPAWVFVQTARNFLLLSTFLAGGGVGLVWLVNEVEIRRQRQKEREEEAKKRFEIHLARKEAEWEAQRKVREEKREAEASKVQAERQEKEELNREAKEKRKARSAEEVAKSGLKDFL